MDASQWFAAPKIPHKTSLMLQKFVGLRNTVTAERAPTHSLYMSEQLDCFLMTRLMLGITQRHRIVELGVVALRVNHAELEAAVKKTLEKPGLNIFGSSDDGPRKRARARSRAAASR